MFLFTRDCFLNHCSMKPLVICQPPSKFDMFIFLFTYNLFHIIFVLNEGPEFCIFGGGTQKRGQSSKQGKQTRVKLWYKCKEVLIN